MNMLPEGVKRVTISRKNNLLTAFYLYQDAKRITFFSATWDTATRSITLHTPNEAGEMTEIGLGHFLPVYDETERYSVLVSNIGWVTQDEPNYALAYEDFRFYRDERGHDQVSLWSNKSDDPIADYYRDEEDSDS